MSDLAVEAHQLVKKFPTRPGTGDRPSPPSPLPEAEGRRGEGQKRRWLFWKKEPKAMFTAVSGVDIQIQRGEIFGLLGPNGAGKSTTIRMLCTLLEPTSGTAHVNGYDIVRQANEVILVGRTLTSMLTTTITSAVMLLLAGLLFGFTPTGSAFAAILTAIPMLVGLYGFGFAFAGIVLLMREANTMVDVGSFLVQGFSGTNFPVQSLPYWLIPISLMLPLTYGLDAVRGLLLKTNTLLPINVEIIILVVFMFVMLWIGAQVFYRIERRVRTLGTLGQH